MKPHLVWETIKAEGGELLQAVKRAIEEGNARRIVIKQKGRLVAEFPLTVGVVGAVVAPILAAIGALVALLSECSIEIERVVRGTNGHRSSGSKKGPRSSG